MKAFTFKGGVHPEYKKEGAASKAISNMPAPNELVFPLSQHIGAPAKPCVKKGEKVLTGQMIAKSAGFVSVPVHSSVSGTVKAIEPRQAQMGILQESIVVENDGQYSEVEFEPVRQSGDLNVDEVKKKISSCGIAGMGGATFPTHVKLSAPPDKPIDTVILNGAECEPYLCADHRLMVEKTQDVVSGFKIIAEVLGAKNAIIAIEENKPDAIDAMEKACRENCFEIARLKIKYPQGGEKQLIDAVCGRQVPSGGLPMDVGVVVQNVGTAAAVYSAVFEGKPLIERIVTVTGSAAGEPSNLKVKIGTPVGAVLEHCKADLKKMKKLVLGGPMMGFAQHSTAVPVVKGTSGILAMAEKDIPAGRIMECIRCGRCIGACPMGLVPSYIASLCDADMYDRTEEAGATDCMECGSCAHECPSHIPLVQKIRLAKAHILMAKKRKA